MTIEKALDKFITRKRLAGLSDKSIRNYKMFIGFFVRFIGEDTAVDVLTPLRELRILARSAFFVV